MTIYKQVNTIDHNPELRSWYYDDFGNRIDKKTGQYVILVLGKEKKTEDYYDTKPCDTE